MTLGLELLPVEPRRYERTLVDKVFTSLLEQKNPVIAEILFTLYSHKLLQSKQEMKIRLCLDEAIINAIKHGNDEDPGKKVRVQLFADGTRWSIRVEDEGEGFNPAGLPDPDREMSLLREGGRGILLMNEFMSRICYCGRGNVLYLFHD